MKVSLNGQEVPVSGEISVASLIAERKINPAAAVVEYNGAILAQENWQGTMLKENDCLEIVSFVGGG
ncbi:MAG: sulfur carrier protein ThiS [Candidatus Omnitrophota bacterium]|nr:sulfur carrier protein ThiS [Candidatus Omnitrophota bacterium]